MNTRIWHRYAIGWAIDNIIWPLGWETNIPVKGKIAGKDLMHTINGRVEMFCKRNRRTVIVKFHVLRGNYPPLQIGEIVARLQRIEGAEMITNDGMVFKFALDYAKTWPKLDFYQSAISLMEILLVAFGIEDKDKTKLANFAVFDEFLIKAERGAGEWERANGFHSPKTWDDETARARNKAGLSSGGIPLEKIGAFANSLSIVPPNPVEELKKKGI